VVQQAPEPVAWAMTLSFQLKHRFPTTTMDMRFEVPADGVAVLFGPSGSGKSTIINAAAGLMHPDECRIAVGDQVLVDTQTGVWLPPEKRRIGLVFQDSRLFPHMSVETNLRFGLRRIRDQAGPRGFDFDTIVQLLGIGALLRRRPHTLSGGERQRVAIGRALLARPHLLLMDEPLASLDAPRKAEILPFLRQMKSTLRLPVLYVTHSLEELAQLADSLVLIEAGRVTAYGPVSDVSGRSDSLLGRRDDAASVLQCRIEEHDNPRLLTLLRGGGSGFWVPLLGAPVGAECRIRIPAREVILAAQPPQLVSLHNAIPGAVRRVTPDAGQNTVMVEVALPDGALLSRVTPDAVTRLSLAEGTPVLGLIKSTSIEVLGAE
jgi:molybdate transport system ATP-binding protein